VIENNLYDLSITKLDFKIFLIAILLLASAPFFSSIIFLYLTLKSFRKSYKELIADKYNLLILIVSIIMILQCILYTFFIDNELEKWSEQLHWAGIANWIPLFILFIGLQPYLSTPEKRLKTAKFFIASSFPVLASCLLQFIFGWHGPYETLNGLIKWFQIPYGNEGSITGLFNNPNYTGSWLTLIFPLSLACFKDKFSNKEYLKFKILFLIISLFTFTILLTNSRAAFIGLIFSIPIIFGKKIIKYFNIFLLLAFIVIIINYFLPSTIFYEILNNSFLQDNFLLSKFSSMFYSLKSEIRFSIWGQAINFIQEKPLFGWGSSTFPILFRINNDNWYGHTHNLFLELSLSYGLIVASLIFLFLFKIIYKSYLIIFKNKINYSFIDRGFWTGAFIFFILAQLYDVLFFDFRLNIASWIFLAALKSILNKQIRKQSI